MSWKSDFLTFNDCVYRLYVQYQPATRAEMRGNSNIRNHRGASKRKREDPCSPVWSHSEFGGTDSARASDLVGKDALDVIDRFLKGKLKPSDTVPGAKYRVEPLTNLGAVDHAFFTQSYILNRELAKKAYEDMKRLRLSSIFYLSTGKGVWLLRLKMRWALTTRLWIIF